MTGVVASRSPPPMMAMPISPPNEVPTQSTRSRPSAFRSVTQSDAYCGMSYSPAFGSRSERPRPTMSGQTTR